MVDPLEAERLAVKQMEEIKAKEKLKVRVFSILLDCSHTVCPCMCQLAHFFEVSLKVTVSVN